MGNCVVLPPTTGLIEGSLLDDDTMDTNDLSSISSVSKTSSVTDIEGQYVFARTGHGFYITNIM